LGRASQFVESRSSLNISKARRQRLKDRLQLFESIRFGADHQAVATLHAPYSAARTCIHVMNSAALQFGGSPDVVFVETVAAVDDGISGLHGVSQRLNGGFGGFACRNHHPNGSWFGKFLY